LGDEKFRRFQTSGPPARRCALGWCDKCGVDRMPTAPEEENKGADALLVPYYKYDKIREPTNYNTDGTTRFANPDGEQKYKEHLKLCKHALPIGEFMAYYREKLRLFVYHFSYMRMTSRMRVERQGITPGDITLIMDYSEKLNKMQRTQIQSQHWSEHAMTIEVAVAEAYPKLDPGKRAAIVARLSSTDVGERGKALDELRALQKKVYYHCSDYKPQVAAVTTHNMEVMLRELIASGELGEGCGCTDDGRLKVDGYAVWLKTDGCAKQYKCGKAMYLLCKLAGKLNVTIDQMLEVTGHGKDEADGHGGVFKNWLLGEMKRGDFMSDAAPVIEAADVVDGEEVSMAEVLTEHARKGLTDLKPAAMNAKRRANSNTVERKFLTYTEADIRHAPEIVPMTSQLDRDAPADAHSLTKATMAHNNYRADPELQRAGAHPVIAVRRLACACDGCRRALKRPVATGSDPYATGTRYAPHDDCARAAMMGRRNDWKLVSLKPSGEAAAVRMEEDNDLQVQDQTDGIAACTHKGDMLAFEGKDKKHAPNGYYIAEALGEAYETTEELKLPLMDADGNAVILPKGSMVIDCVYWNRQVAAWYTRYADGDARGLITVPSHLILRSGLALAEGRDCAPAEPKQPAKRKKKSPTDGENKRKLAAEGARVVPQAVHDDLLEELDRRDKL
jgi:hypothetical protein